MVFIKHTSMKPSTEHETRIWPSGEKQADSGCVLLPNCIFMSIIRLEVQNIVENDHERLLTFIVCPRVVGCISSSSCFIAAVPLKRSNCVPGGNNPGPCENNK